MSTGLERADDAAALREEVLALLLEPLGVDSMIGLNALERLARGVDTVAQSSGVASLPMNGSTLQSFQAAVATCRSVLRLIDLAEVHGVHVGPSGSHVLTELINLDGLEDNLPTLDRVPRAALTADVASVARAGRLLPQLLARRERAERSWPPTVLRSVLQLDVQALTLQLEGRRWRLPVRSDVRKRVEKHLRPEARDLSDRDLARLLRAAVDYRGEIERFDNTMSSEPSWWRWLLDGQLRFAADRYASLLWAVNARDTGVVATSSVDMLADPTVRSLLQIWLDTAREPLLPGTDTAGTHSAARIAAGLMASSTWTSCDALDDVERWYTTNIEHFDRVACAMDVQRIDDSLRLTLAGLLDEIEFSIGAIDPSRTMYRDIQASLRAELARHVGLISFSEHAIENVDLVAINTGLGMLERALGEATRTSPVARGKLTVAIAGRTKSGKTTLRKALTRDPDPAGIGRGEHRTTRQTVAFDHGFVTFLDTPGFAARGDEAGADAGAARVACRAADAVIWNYADTLREEEANELMALLLDGKPTIVVLNVKQRVDTLWRLKRFIGAPDDAFDSEAQHATRIEQVFGSVGVLPPKILGVHAGAAREALTYEDQSLVDGALEASRLPELERSLAQILQKQSIPLRAIRLADGVRAPLDAVRRRLADELPMIDELISELERSAPAQHEALLRVIRAAGEHAQDRLHTKHQQAKAELPDVLSGLDGVDHQQRWKTFIDELDLWELMSELESTFEHELSKQGRAISRHDVDETEPDEPLDIDERPDPSGWRRVGEFAKGAVSSVLTTIGVRELLTRIGWGSGGGPSGGMVVVVGLILEAVSGGAKAVNRDVEQAREAMAVWADGAELEAKTAVDRLFDQIHARIGHVTRDANRFVNEQFHSQSFDIDQSRARLRTLERLQRSVEDALDDIDAVMMRRFVTLAGGDPAWVLSARRFPGVEVRMTVDQQHVARAEACVQDEVFAALSERILVCPESDVTSVAPGNPARGGTNDD